MYFFIFYFAEAREIKVFGLLTLDKSFLQLAINTFPMSSQSFFHISFQGTEQKAHALLAQLVQRSIYRNL